MISAMMDFLATYHQQGDANGMMSAAQAVLHTIPDDLVALQFMGLALLWTGQKDRALALFRRAAGMLRQQPAAISAHACQHAASVTMQEAMRPEFAGGWREIANVTELHGFHALAQHAREMAECAQRAQTRNDTQAVRPLPHRDGGRNSAVL